MPGRGKAAKTPIGGANAIVRLDAVSISGKIEHIEIQRAALPRKGQGWCVGRSVMSIWAWDIRILFTGSTSKWPWPDKRPQPGGEEKGGSTKHLGPTTRNRWRQTHGLSHGGIKEGAWRFCLGYARQSTQGTLLDTARIRQWRGGQVVCRLRTRHAVD